jgi:DNA-binding CsgD family transcriptional regulator
MPKIFDAIRHTQSKDGGIVLDTLHGQMFCLNPVGSAILELLEQGCDEAHIADEIGRIYGVSIETVRVDVREFIEALKGHEIVEPDGHREIL